MPWKRMLAYVTGRVNEDLLRRIEYLHEENRILRNQIDSRILLTNNERCALAKEAVSLGKLMIDQHILEFYRSSPERGAVGGNPPNTPTTIPSPVIQLDRGLDGFFDHAGSAA